MPDLIALSDLQTLTSLNSLVESRRVAPGILDAHDELRKILGTTGYDIVYDANPTYTGLDAKYLTLHTHIKAFMAWRARQRSMPELFAEPDKAGIYVKSGDEHAAVSNTTLSMLTNQAKDRADRKLETLLEYLSNNTVTFTWWETTLEDEDRITEQKSVGGFSLRRATRQDPSRG